MISGAREASPSFFRRLVARALAREMYAFVVPGPEVARACGLDLEAAGLRLTDTPRHAGVLVLVGEPPAGLKEAAAVAYAQMPRPRVVLALGTEDVSPLPGPDASAGVEQEALEQAVAALRRSIAEGAFSAEVAGFEVDEIRTRTEYVCPMHPEVVSDEPGSCPKCGMDLVPRESAGGMDHADMVHSGHDYVGHEEADRDAQGHAGHGEARAADGEPATGYTCPMHPEVVSSEPGSCPICGMYLVPREEAAAMGHKAHGRAEEQHGSHEQHGAGGGADHEGMDHGDMGFMSMVEMTKDLPRSSDGLPMEWVEAPFGPLFPGLPAGLSLKLTLDGDTVAEAEVASAVGERALGEFAGPAACFVDRMARLDPLSPVAYRLLASRAVQDAAGIPADERATLAAVGALERERAASHLNWLAGFAHLLGHAWLEGRAVRLTLALRRAADAEDAARLRGEISKLAQRIERTPLLRRKLWGIGRPPGDAEALGPVARAGGTRTDARAEDGIYRDLLGFEPVVREGRDALSRLRVRLEEAEQSLEIVRGVGHASIPALDLDGAPSGAGMARIETPRGAADLRVTLEGGAVRDLELETPSTRHLGLVESLTAGEELANALIGVASLDLSPWEVAQ